VLDLRSVEKVHVLLLDAPNLLERAVDVPAASSKKRDKKKKPAANRSHANKRNNNNTTNKSADSLSTEPQTPEVPAAEPTPTTATETTTTATETTQESVLPSSTSITSPSQIQCDNLQKVFGLSHTRTLS
jgi:hypothetical protein